MNRASVVAWGLLLAGCVVDLELPPPPGPASLSGTLVYAIPGKTQLAPAVGATVELSNSSLRTVANEEGFFQLDRVSATKGTLVFRLDTNGDGKMDRQKNVDLAALGLRAGRDLNLGQVVLGRNASVNGKAVREDRRAVASGHGGSTVFVPEGPYATTTADDGSFVLAELPEGPLTLAVFRPGFEVASADVVLRSGEELRTQQLVLAVSTAPLAKGTLQGRVVLEPPPQDAASAQVSLYVGGRVVSGGQAQADGTFHFDALDVGLYDLTVVRAGYQSSLTRNIYIQAGSNVLADVALAPGDSVTPDAGALLPADAGQVVDVGVLNDGGVDPGPPAAVLAPAITSVTPDAGSARFSGELSVGVQPLRYAWSIASDAGTALTLSTTSQYSALATSGLPPAGQSATVSLVVTDPLGRVSAPATGQLFVSDRPMAHLTPPGPLTLPPAATLSAAGSVDSLGLGLRYEWSVDYGGLLLSSLTNPTISVSGTAVGPARVTVRVVNAFGLASAPVSVDLFVTVAGNNFAVDAGSPQLVDAGTVVFLNGSLLTASTDAFGFLWEERGTFGSPLSINSADQQRADIFPPLFSGPDQQRRFSFKASRPKGCGFTQSAACEVRESETVVTVVDSTPPLPAFYGGTEVSRFGPLRMSANETLLTSSINTATVRFTDLALGVDLNVLRTYDSLRNELSLEFLSPLTSGVTYRVTLDGLEDLSSRRNKMALATADFVAYSTHYSSTFKSAGAGSATLSPTPGVGLLRFTTAMGIEDRALVVGRKDSPDNQWNFNFISSTQGSGTLPEQSTLPLPSRTLPGRRMHTANSRLFAQLAKPSGVGWATAVDGVLSVYDSGTNLWQQLTRAAAGSTRYAAPGPLFSDGTLLYALVSNNGLRATRLDTTGQVTAWGFPDAVTGGMAEVIDPGAANFPNNPQLVAGGVLASGARYVAAFEPMTGARLHVYRSIASGSWQALADADADLSLGATAVPVDVRVAASGSTVVVAAMLAIGGTPQVKTLMCQMSACDWALVSVPAGVHDGFDLDVRGPAALLVLPVSGALKLLSMDLSVSPGVWVQENGPHPNGVFNDDPTCMAEAPEMARNEFAMWLTWGEKCTAAPWQVVLRRVD